LVQIRNNDDDQGPKPCKLDDVSLETSSPAVTDLYLGYKPLDPPRRQRPAKLGQARPSPARPARLPGRASRELAHAFYSTAALRSRIGRSLLSNRPAAANERIAWRVLSSTVPATPQRQWGSPVGVNARAPGQLGLVGFARVAQRQIDRLALVVLIKASVEQIIPKMVRHLAQHATNSVSVIIVTVAAVIHGVPAGTMGVTLQ
jgi:hypothetical protein